MNLRVAIRCKLTNRKLGVYLDNDSSMPISPKEIKKIVAHLSECEKCTTKLEDLAKIKGALSRLKEREESERESTEILRQSLKKISAIEKKKQPNT